jgi:hypothetical protein
MKMWRMNFPGAFFSARLRMALWMTIFKLLISAPYTTSSTMVLPPPPTLWSKP